MRKLLSRPDLREAAEHFTMACMFSRWHDAAAADALAEFGDHGAQISGCVRDHFPADVKEHLRILARAVTTATDAAYAARPPRVQMQTIRALGRAIAARDGSGFYGPQP